MDRGTINNELDRLLEAARSRPMTADELERFHALKLALPSFGQEAKEARERLRVKHFMRRLLP